MSEPVTRSGLSVQIDPISRADCHHHQCHRQRQQQQQQHPYYQDYYLPLDIMTQLDHSSYCHHTHAHDNPLTLLFLLFLLIIRPCFLISECHRLLPVSFSRDSALYVDLLTAIMATKVQDESVAVQTAVQDAAEALATKKPDAEKGEKQASSISTATEEAAAKKNEQKSNESTLPVKDVKTVPTKETETAAVAKNEESDIDPKDIIDDAVFGQLLEMDDDDEEHEFSKSIVINYFEQAQETFEQMDAAIEKRDIEGYAKLGHFLKGSSATLGLQKVQAICEKIQNSHASANEESLPEYDGDVVLKCGIELLAQLKHEYKQAEQYLCQFYEMDASIFDINNAQ